MLPVVALATVNPGQPTQDRRPATQLPIVPPVREKDPADKATARPRQRPPGISFLQRRTPDWRPWSGSMGLPDEPAARLFGEFPHGKRADDERGDGGKKGGRENKETAHGNDC